MSSPPFTGLRPITSLASFLVMIPAFTAETTFSYVFFLRSASAGIESISYLNSISSYIGANHSFKSLSTNRKWGMIVSSYKANLASATLL